MPVRVDPDSWWQYDETEGIICGNCLNDELAKTERGEYTGDERVTMNMVHQLLDHEEEAYQCDGCNTQSEGYDSVLDEYEP